MFLGSVEKLIFKSGFETGTAGLPEEAVEVFVGNDTSTSPHGNWDAFRARLTPPHPWALPAASDNAPLAADAPRLGYFDIHYMGGTADDRFARLLREPARPENHVLHYCVNRANEPIQNGRCKARVQAAIYDNCGITSLKQEVRLFLHPDLSCLHAWERGFDWFTLHEFWFEPAWTRVGHPFRISISLHRDPGGGDRPLHFSVHGQPFWEEGMSAVPTAPGWAVPTWGEIQRGVEVPVGNWMELAMEYRQGDGETGRFAYRMREEGGNWQEVFTIANWTYNPRSATPAPLWGWNPMKLYTSQELVDYVRSCGGRTQLYWDDLAIMAQGIPGKIDVL